MELTIEDIVKASDVYTKFDIPEWGGWVFIRPMPSGTAISFQKKYFGKGKTALSSDYENKEVIYEMIRLCVMKSDRTSMFSDSEKTTEILDNKPWNIVSRIFQKCVEVNGLSEESSNAIKKK